MKTQNIQQEILLFTATTFSNRQWCETNASKKEAISCASHEQLERACWNGMLNEMLPEIMPSTEVRRNLYLWQVLARESFLVIEMSEQRWPAEEEFSIDPYLFMRVTNAN